MTIKTYLHNNPNAQILFTICDDENFLKEIQCEIRYPMPDGNGYHLEYIGYGETSEEAFENCFE